MTTSTIDAVPSEVREAAAGLTAFADYSEQYDEMQLTRDYAEFAKVSCYAYMDCLYPDLHPDRFESVMRLCTTIQQWYDRKTLNLFWHDNTLLYGNPDEPDKAREVGAITDHQGYYTWTGKHIQNGVCQNHNSYGKYSDRAAAMKHCEGFARKSLNLPEVSP
jgi:hypothetical protein